MVGDPLASTELIKSSLWIVRLFLQGENWLSWMFEKLVVVMVFYFILSIINSMAQSYAKRIQQQVDSEEKTK